MFISKDYCKHQLVIFIIFSGCVDTYSLCPLMAKNSLCPNSWVKSVCKKSCKHSSCKQCVDKNKNCPKWAVANEYCASGCCKSQRYGEYMKGNCEKSCNLC